MSENKIKIILQLQNEATEALNRAMGSVRAQVGKTIDATKVLGQEMERVGRKIDRTGRQAAMLGAMMTGPLLLAFKNSAQHSAAVRSELQRLETITREFQLQLAEALLPTINKIVNALSNLFNMFNSLSPGMKEMIVQTTMAVGIFLTMGGLLGVLVGKIVLVTGVAIQMTAAFAGFVAVNAPLIAIVAAIGGIIYAMYKWEAVSDFIMNTYQVMFLSLHSGFLTLELAVNSFVSLSLYGVSKVIEAMSQIPGPAQQALAEMSVALFIAAQDADFASDTIKQKIASNNEEILGIFRGENGSWAEAFKENKEGIISSIDEIIERFKNLGKTNKDTVTTSTLTWGQFLSGMNSGLSQLGVSLAQAGQDNKDFAKAAAGVAIALAIINTAQSVTKAFADYPWPFSLVVGGIMAAAGAIQIATIASQKFHSGGMIRAHNGLAVDEVPIIAQTGEGVLSRRGMSALGGAGELNRLNSGGRGGGGMFGDINIFIQGGINPGGSSIDEMAEQLGFAFEREVRTARG